MRPRSRSLVSLAGLCGAIALAVVACAGAPPPKASVAVAAIPAPARDRDTDCDGVADVDDACPTAAEDRDGFQDDDGCPDPDNDQDRIPDECDQCPDQPETYNGIDDEDGCPDVGLIRVSQGEIRILMHVFFAPGSTQIRPESRPLLDEVAHLMRENPRFERIATLGHASADEASAQRLSERRAEAVRSALLALGIEPQRVEAHGYGATRPLASNTRPEDREKNRRTEFQIVRLDGHDLRAWNGKDLVDVPQPEPPPTPPQRPKRPIEPCVPRVIPPLPREPCRAEPRKSVPVEATPKN
jgi:outer membrane protein OmpA-like peptidoglycan-associated protein